jgi:hypothetical protein
LPVRRNCLPGLSPSRAEEGKKSLAKAVKTTAATMALQAAKKSHPISNRYRSLIGIDLGN